MAKQIPQKPHLLKIIPPFENSFVIKGDDIAWNNPWHFHPEVELLYCIKGKGTNFVGNSIRTIEEGELLLLGKNLPHTRQRDKEYYHTHTDEVPESIVIQFREEFLGERFFEIREFNHIHGLLVRALRGLKFHSVVENGIASMLRSIQSSNGASAIIELLSLLDSLARSEAYTFINSVNYVSDVHEKSSQKINKVYHYTIGHFREPISLETVASLTNHSPAAFCRYFKTRTRKSYVQYLTEIRIAYACELLMEGNLDVGQVCFSSGFNNLSHFHKQFRKFVHLTPSEYRSKSKKKVPVER